MTTVFVLAVLWLIVVVPMIVRRTDERRRERRVDRFGRSMRALGRPHPGGLPAGSQQPHIYVPRERHAAAAVAVRRPVPVAQEALMYPVDRAEMSAARTQMMARRRRSLGLLSVGTVTAGLLALIMGGALWLLAAPFVLGLVGYLYFLRSQALRDRDRRVTRQIRAADRRDRSYDATSGLGGSDNMPASRVRIDDDDIELHNLDTVDLTGLYNEDAPAVAAQRRAS